MVIIALDRIVKKQLQHSHLGFDLGEEVSGLNTIKDVSDIQAWAKHWSSALLAELVQWSEEHNQSIIQRAMRYIDQHYKEKCSLQDVASSDFNVPALGAITPSFSKRLNISIVSTASSRY